MHYYHCSPTSDLTVLKPGKPRHFDKPSLVYMTTLLPMALMYGVKNYEYTYGYTKEGQIYYEEYFPNALAELYKGKSASLYLCAPETVETTRIPNEAVSPQEVPVLEEIFIPDVYEAILEQERLGTLPIYRFETLSQRKLDWIKKVEAEEIRNRVKKTGTMAEYYRRHYPESWAMAEAEL